MQAVGFDAAGGVGQRLEAPGFANPGVPAEPAAVEFVLRRNCSLSPRALMAVFGSMVGLAFVFGAVFAALGAWMVLPFAGVELLALALAFLVYGAHATDGERVWVGGDKLTVEVRNGNRVRTHEFALYQVRLVRQAGPARMGGPAMVAERLLVACRGRELEVGRHLGAQRRVGFERDLRAALAAATTAKRDVQV